MMKPRPRRDAGDGNTGPSWWLRVPRVWTGRTAGAADPHQAQPLDHDDGRDFGCGRAFHPLLLAENVGDQGTKHGNPATMRVCSRWAVGDWQGTNRGPIGDSLT